jgi:riboflavin kinase
MIYCCLLLLLLVCTTVTVSTATTIATDIVDVVIRDKFRVVPSFISKRTLVHLEPPRRPNGPQQQLAQLYLNLPHCYYDHYCNNDPCNNKLETALQRLTRSPTSHVQKNGIRRYRMTINDSNSNNISNIIDDDDATTVQNNATATTITPSYLLTNHIYRLRGVVDTGYGRGGKQLGFPTANLGPASVWDAALTHVATGVYFGHAVLEREQLTPEEEDDDDDDDDPMVSSSSTTTSRRTNNQVPYATVVNIGYAPTFVGQENSVKIIEAHLIRLSPVNDDDDPPMDDFYNVTMRLQLIGYLRSERKFPSLADLIVQIQQDVRMASMLLDQEPYSSFRRDPFLTSTTTTPWIGQSGGNTTTSWEWQDMPAAQNEIFTA